MSMLFYGPLAFVAFIIAAIVVMVILFTMGIKLIFLFLGIIIMAVLITLFPAILLIFIFLCLPLIILLKILF